MTETFSPAPPKTNGRSLTKKLTLWPLVCAIYFMVAGGPFGLEEIVARAGYSATFMILLITPAIWSFPTALMVSELSSALPEEGGFYAWVRRALGPFWGFQEVWLTMMGSLFDMALYPVLFTGYLGRLFPALREGHWPLTLALGMIAVCVLWNLFGARAVGEGSLWLSFVLLGPFLALTIAGFLQSASGAPAEFVAQEDLLGGILLAMWNYMGWDNVTTIAGEVYQPQKTYPRAMAIAVSAVTISYLLPVGAAAFAGVGSEPWETGGWVDIGRMFGGSALAAAITLAGMVGAIGTFNALMLSLSRLPMVMGQDGLLPKVFARTLPGTGAPWVAIVACAIFWALLVPLGFVSLVILDVLLTGLSILLEFVALVVLRIREPELPRPYKVPGGTPGAVVLGICPALLIGLTIARNADERIGPINGLLLGMGLILMGPVVYWLIQRMRPKNLRTQTS